MILKTSDFAYELPPELIAQSPAPRRDASRLLVLERATGKMTHRTFADIIEYFHPGDVLVLNSSKVIPARLMGRKESGASVEVVLLRARGELWEALARPGKRLKEGALVVFNSELSAVVEGVTPEGNRLIRMVHDPAVPFMEILERAGSLPLPPYIKSKPSDPGRYQTVYAKEEGSAAAPTAGLHFTPELLSQIEAAGVNVVKIVLHVGLGTFRPVKSEDILGHTMHSEWFEITPEAAEAINRAPKHGGRVFCAGTTSCRALESAAPCSGESSGGGKSSGGESSRGECALDGVDTDIVIPFRGDTDIFIYPGYTFRATDALITNFHLPESTLLMLVSAFAQQKCGDGRSMMLETYHAAVEERYRFFSFGDAMLIL